MVQRQWAFFSIAVLAALAILIAGCSKPSSSTSSAPVSAASSAGSPEQASASPMNAGVSAVAKPCSLLTQAEVESALGKGATMTHYANPRTGMNECKLKPAAGSDLDELVIVVHETTPESWLMVKKGYMEDKRVKQVRHLGDDAINVGGYAGIWARKGDKYVQVFGSLKPERDEKAELFLLEKALSRL